MTLAVSITIIICL